ncbi:DUF2523 family protein [Vibrio hannami]|uniref:DUF2523 family protein n=1 Tax=Vibrio hannami TaxID=2717094 RepID=UPI00240ED15B|nr:DUF2523 family protein [Vibrio hannami]MDG3085471.1 DUF2523 family protein [Vibrio hannami]
MEWIINLFDKLLSFLYNLLLSLVTVLQDMFYWILEQVMKAIEFLLSGIAALFAPMDISQYLTGLPSEVGWMLGQIGLPQCLAMITAAILIRLTLQLIPFTRLGS